MNSSDNIQKAFINATYNSYDRFKVHIGELLTDCGFVTCSFGQHADSVGLISHYELEDKPYSIRFKYDIEIVKSEDYDYDYYNSTGYSDWTAIKNIPPNTCRMIKRGGEYMDVQFIHEGMYQVGEIYFDNLDNLDTHILKWVLS